MPLILGAEATGEAHPILVDSSGRVLIAQPTPADLQATVTPAAAAEFEVVQPTPADLLIGAHGWDGAAWRKLPLLWGYTDRLFYRGFTSNATTGDNSFVSGAVPTGEIWVLKSASTRNVNTASTRQWMGFVTSPAGGWFHIDPSVPANETSEWAGEIILQAGDNISFLMRDCTSGDDIEVLAFGYKMKIAE